MRALVYEAPEVMRLREVAVPVPADDDVLIRVAYAGICGSELSGFLGQSSLRRPPLVFGHELSGWVEQVGSRVPDVVGLRRGEAVTANPMITCGTCGYCITGREQLCAGRQLLGAHVAGCNADFVCVPAVNVLPLPSGMGLRDAAMVEPAACALRAVQLSGATPSSHALVVGAGPIGLFILQVLAQYGVRSRYVADLNHARLARAESMGATQVAASGEDLAHALLRFDTGGVDVAFDAVGAPQTRRDCLASTKPGGRLVFVGLHSDETSLPVNSIIRSEVSLTGVFAYSRANFRTALDWLAEGRIGLEDGVVAAPLEAGPQWYARLVKGDDAAKVLLQPGRPS